MQVCVWIGVPWLATAVFWSVLWGAFVGCVDMPFPDPPPVARVIAEWDPRACGDPHRVALELEDDAGAMLAASVPCTMGSIALDAPHFGIYRGRIYAWTIEDQARSITPVQLTVDEPVVRWLVATP